MGQSNRAFIFLLMALFGVWAIAQSNDPEQEELLERIHALEGKIAHQEWTEKSIIKESQEFQNKWSESEKIVSLLEGEKADLQKRISQFEAVVVERDSLQKELAERTAERDGMSGRCDQLKKGIMSLLEKDEIAAIEGSPAEGSPAFQKATWKPTGSKTPAVTAGFRREKPETEKANKSDPK